MVAHNDRRLELNYRLDAFPLNQQRQSTEGYVQPTVYSIFREMIISVIFPDLPLCLVNFYFLIL